MQCKYSRASGSKTLSDRGDGAPGENRTPNLMVRSHALYPIELRAHRGEIASSNYNGNKTVSPISPNRARTVEIGGFCHRKFAVSVKVSGPAQNLPDPAFYPYVGATR